MDILLNGEFRAGTENERLKSSQEDKSKKKIVTFSKLFEKQRQRQLKGPAFTPNN